MPDSKYVRVELLVNFLYPGIILKGDAYTLSGDKIWEGKKPIPLEIIKQLKAKNIKKIFYNRPTEITRQKITNPLIDNENIEKAFDITHEMEKAVQNNSLIPEKGVNEVVDGFLDNISSMQGTVLNLTELKDFDDYTYTHSINVCLISMLFAKRLGFNEKGLKIIGVSGLLHDIGKIMVPREIVNKPVQLTREEFEIMKKHPVYGYELIKSQSSYGPIIQKSVLLHHEKYDGKGYPFAFRGERIGDLPQIISLADVFDAITSERSYKMAHPYWYALNRIRKDSGTAFSPRLTKTFVQDMPRFLTEGEIFALGSFVLLNTGEVAEVIDYQYPQTLRPEVNVYINSKNQVVRYPIPINLEFDDSRYIENVFDDEKIVEILLIIKERFEKHEKQELYPETEEEVSEAISKPLEEDNYDEERDTSAIEEEIQTDIDDDLLIDDMSALK